MTIQTEMLQVLRSTDGQAAVKKPVIGACIEALESGAGQKAMRTAIRDMLRDGFANLAPIDDPEKRKLVHNNQEWLFDTVRVLFDVLVAGNKKVPG